MSNTYLAARMEPETTRVGSKDGTEARRRISVYTPILWGRRDCLLKPGYSAVVFKPYVCVIDPCLLVSCPCVVSSHTKRGGISDRTLWKGQSVTSEARSQSFCRSALLSLMESYSRMTCIIRTQEWPYGEVCVCWPSALLTLRAREPFGSSSASTGQAFSRLQPLPRPWLQSHERH